VFVDIVAGTSGPVESAEMVVVVREESPATDEAEAVPLSSAGTVVSGPELFWGGISVSAAPVAATDAEFGMAVLTLAAGSDDSDAIGGGDSVFPRGSIDSAVVPACGAAWDVCFSSAGSVAVPVPGDLSRSRSVENVLRYSE
jgi:hypothetical protein